MSEVRPAAPEDSRAIAQAHVETWRVAYKGIVPDAYLATLSVERREPMWRERLAARPPGHQTVVGLAGGAVVGFSSVGPMRGEMAGYTGEIYAIYVLPAYWKTGLGRELFLTSARFLASVGHLNMGLWVLEDNAQGRAFYERMGGKPLGLTLDDTQMGAALREVAYGWPSLDRLIGKAGQGI